MQGIFITFEGIEGCGKSTQTGLLGKYLEEHGHSVILTREPGGTSISEAIRDILLSNEFDSMHPHTEVLLYLASRAQHITEVIKPALQSGMVVICDRFTDSTLVYQCHARGLNIGTVAAMNSFATDGISPHLTFVLDVEPAEGLRRARSRNLKDSRIEDRLENEAIEFHNSVRNGYLKRAQEYPDRIHVVRSDKNKAEVHGEIQRIVDGFMRKERK